MKAIPRPSFAQPLVSSAPSLQEPPQEASVATRCFGAFALDNWTLEPPETANEEDRPDLRVLEVARKRNSTLDMALEQRLVVEDATLIIVLLKPTKLKLETKSGLGHEGVMPQGNVLWIESGDDTAATFNEAYDFVQISLKTSISLRKAQGCNKFIRNSVVLRDSLIEQLGRSLGGDDGETVCGAYETAVAKVIALRSIAIAAQGARARPLPIWRLRRVRDFVERRLDSPIHLADMARAAGLSRMHFAAQFRAATGVRAHDFLLSRRVERAKALMCKTEAPLVQVALDVGFQAQSHFTTVFKRHTGETPAAWRRQEKGGG